MNLVRFCEYRYQELSLKTQLETEYDCHTDAETKAVHEILNSYRALLKAAFIPKALYDFICVNLGKKKEPEPALLNKVKEEREKAEAAKREVQDSSA